MHLNVSKFGKILLSKTDNFILNSFSRLFRNINLLKVVETLENQAGIYFLLILWVFHTICHNSAQLPVTLYSTLLLQHLQRKILKIKKKQDKQTANENKIKQSKQNLFTSPSFLPPQQLFNSLICPGSMGSLCKSHSISFGPVNFSSQCSL